MVFIKEMLQNYVYYQCELLFKSAIAFVYNIEIMILSTFNCTNSLLFENNYSVTYDSIL